MSELTNKIQMAQVEAAEDAVVASLRAKGLMPPDPPTTEHERLRSAVVERAKGWRFCEDKEVERFDFPEDAALAKAVDALNAFESSHTVEQKDHQ